jgi:hypothetical protein
MLLNDFRIERDRREDDRGGECACAEANALFSWLWPER